MYKVLLIDDEKPVHLAIRALVDWTAINAAEPVSAYNGREGLQAMETLKPDIVFVDMSMPLVDGRDFLAVASRDYPHSQYIVISGYDDFQYARAAIRFNVVDYLLKPLDHEELEQALKKALSRLRAGTATPLETRAPAATMAAVRDYIDLHPQEAVSLSLLSEQFRMCESELDHLFSAQYGCPVEMYILKARLGQAQELLDNATLRMEDKPR